MIEYTKTVLRKYAEFEGRARRAEYWYFFLAVILFSIVLSIVLGIVGFDERGADMIGKLVQLAILLPCIAVGIRRMHDIDKSGWFILIPLYNLYLAAQPGTVGPNKYGPDPKGMGENTPVAPTPVTPVVPPTI